MILKCLMLLSSVNFTQTHHNADCETRHLKLCYNGGIVVEEEDTLALLFAHVTLEPEGVCATLAADLTGCNNAGI